jgi:GH35 family endo-1,4-beta-xylanase
MTDSELQTYTDQEIDRIRKTDLTIKIVDQNGSPVNGATIDVEQTSHEFMFGCMCAGTQNGDSNIDDYFKIFNATTLCAIHAQVEPLQDQYHFEWIDKAYSWLVANGFKIKLSGVYDLDLSTPEWCRNLPKDQKLQQQLELVNKLMTRCPKASIIDAVNEPLHFLTGPQPSDVHPYVKSINPNIKICINEFGPFFDGGYEFINYLNGVTAPWDVIGIQSHGYRHTVPSPEGVYWMLNNFSTIGKPIHITEFQVPSGVCPPEHNGSTVWTEELQRLHAWRLYRTAFAHASVNFIGWWDLTDSTSWITTGGLIRANGTPKPAYYEIKKLLTETWKTKTQVTTDSNGNAKVRGFKGNYKITTTKGTSTVSNFTTLSEPSTVNYKITTTTPAPAPSIPWWKRLFSR